MGWVSWFGCWKKSKICSENFVFEVLATIGKSLAVRQVRRMVGLKESVTSSFFFQFGKPLLFQMVVSTLLNVSVAQKMLKAGKSKESVKTGLVLLGIEASLKRQDNKD